MTVPDPYARSIFHGKPLDNATIARLKQAETKLGYELTITQGIGGAAASAGTHTEGRAVDLAPWDHANKVRVLRDLGFAAWYRPYIAGLWPAHIHAVLIFDGRDNQRGIAGSAWRQIGSYDRGRNGLADDGRDPNPYRPSPARGFSMEDYRRTFDKPEPKPQFSKIQVVTFNPWVGNKRLRGNVRQLLEDTGRPVGLALQEMKGDPLNMAGYTTITPPRSEYPHPEARSNQLLIRNRGVEILKTGFLDVGKIDDTGWHWGPKGKPKNVWHPAKIYPFARIKTDDQVWMILAGHRVVAGFGLNKAEWKAEDEAIERWFGNRPRVPSLAVMDWNDRVRGDEKYGIADLAERVDAQLEVIGIDGGLVAGADRSRSHKLDEMYGSDAHRPVVVTAKKEK